MKMSLRSLSLLSSGLLLGLSAPLAAVAQDTPAASAEPASHSDSSGEGWDWTVTPYLWATSVSTNLLEDVPPLENESEFSDLISKIDMAAQVHVEGQGDRFGIFGDLTYLSLSDDKDRTRYSSDTSIDTSLTEVAGVWNVDPKRYEGLDVFAGVRHIIVNADVELDPTDPALALVALKVDQSFSDFMVGARYSSTLSDRWGLTFRADGGWGDTDSDFNVSALLRYRVGKGSWILGYRYMDLQVSKAGRQLDLTLHGPVLAFSFGL